MFNVGIIVEKKYCFFNIAQIGSKIHKKINLDAISLSNFYFLCTEKIFPFSQKNKL